MQEKQIRKLRRAVIKEELAAALARYGYTLNSVL